MSDLITRVKDEFGGEVSDKDAKVMVEGVIRAIEAGLKEDGMVKINRFGNFSVKDRSARVGRNPRTGDAVKIPASITVKFKASPVLKDKFIVKKVVKKKKIEPEEEVVVVSKKTKKDKVVATSTKKTATAAPAAKTTKPVAKKSRSAEKSA